MSRTPVPWHCQPEEGNRSTWEILAGAHPVADVWPGTLGPEAAEANAHFIVHAVNNHEALVEAAKAVKEWRSGNPSYADASVVFGILYDAIENTESG